MSAIPLRPAYEDSLMHITFPDDQPVFDGANLTVPLYGARRRRAG